jgi:transcriptional regulator with XRE-family HTH domain
LATDVHIGEALRQAREHLDLDLEDIAQATHVRAAYIDALERLDLDQLPARAFAAGYVKAYARALGLDPAAVVERFKRESPGDEPELHAPFGAQFRRRARSGGLVATAAVVILGLAGWNLVVRVKTAPRPAAAAIKIPPLRAQPSAGPAQLGAPLPAPPEASTPPPYVTPGLAEATAAKGSDAAAVTAQIAAEGSKGPSNSIAVGAAFAPRGQIYGAPRPGAGVVIQALRPMSLVVRGAGGAVYFARQLAAGEAWRAPDVSGLTVDVDVPAAAEVYVQGHATGPLNQPQTPVASLTAPKPPAG